MWAFATYDLRLSERSFWRLTLAQFSALSERWQQAQKTTLHRAAMVCSLIAEVNRDPKKRRQPFGPADFMPKEKPKPLPPEQMAEEMQRMNQILGGDER